MKSRIIKLQLQIQPNIFTLNISVEMLKTNEYTFKVMLLKLFCLSSEKGSTLNGKNLLLWGANSSL